MTLERPHPSHETIPVRAMDRQVRRPWGDGVATRSCARLYGGVIALRNRAFDRASFLSHDCGLPVISVGGIHAGGTGKTPMTLLIATRIQREGYTAAVLSRGYGRVEKRMLCVSPDDPADAAMVGDEPALMRETAPALWLGIGADRRRVAATLLPRLPERAAFVLDDGFQHRRLHRVLDILCLPPDPFHDRLLPAGYLREPLSSINRASIVCCIGAEHDRPIMERTRVMLRERHGALPIYLLFQRPGLWTDHGTGRTAIRPPVASPTAFCGIARPNRFFHGIEEAGIIPSRCLRFPDHHRYTDSDIAELLRYGDTFITTHKDAVRLRGHPLVTRMTMWYLSMKLDFGETDVEESFFRHVIDAIAGRQ